MAEALPEAFESAAAQCPEWASVTAQHVCERVVAHAHAHIAVRGTNGGLAILALERDASLFAATAPLEIELCGETVERTGKPCLLRRGHNGRHRSVL